MPEVSAPGQRSTACSRRERRVRNREATEYALRELLFIEVSFECIHRWNLIGMGVLPPRLPEGLIPGQLVSGPDDVISVHEDPRSILPHCAIPVTLTRSDETTVTSKHLPGSRPARRSTSRRLVAFCRSSSATCFRIRKGKAVPEDPLTRAIIVACRSNLLQVRQNASICVVLPSPL